MLALERSTDHSPMVRGGKTENVGEVNTLVGTSEGYLLFISLTHLPLPLESFLLTLTCLN